MAAMWFSLGFLSYFILLRIVDSVQKGEAKKAGFDCAKCTCHCAGYHCYCERCEKDKEVAAPDDDIFPPSDS